MLRYWFGTTQRVLTSTCNNPQRRHFYVNNGGAGALHSKNASLNRQGKIMNKLFGNRIKGSKKRWYPTHDTTTTNSSTNHSVVFKASQFGKPVGTGNGKNATRRSNVLNKLFMKHITDLLATGEVSEAILGRGLQVTRVKISPDFACVNVYWLGSGDPIADVQLEHALQSSAGLLRHELSQLTLMGEVPRVHFAREKRYANMEQVEALLRNMDFGIAEDESEENLDDKEKEEARRVTIADHSKLDTASIVKQEFFGKSLPEPDKFVSIVVAEAEQHLPEMRHDVLGLDHRSIMSKIVTKMRKSKQAWELHNQIAAAANSTGEMVTEQNVGGTTTALERLNQKLAEAAESAERFDKFLANRRERKNTPERKKYDQRNEYVDEAAFAAAMDAAADAVLSTGKGRRLQDEEDYIYEELESERKS